MISQDHRKLDANKIAERIIVLVRNDPTITVPILIKSIRETMGYTISYQKAWRARQKAIEMAFGNWEQSYKLLPRCLLALQAEVNETIIRSQTRPFIVNQEHVPSKAMFHRLFWTFKPCIDGFSYCKPIVQVDRTWLYGKYTGTLLVAVAQDGNNHILPIAFAIVEGETSEAWFFFLKNLRTHVTPQSGLCLISDRHESIKSAYNREDSGWGEDQTVHVFCIRHIAQNFMRRYKNAKLSKLVVNMGYALTRTMYNRYYRELSEANLDAANWVNQIPKEVWLQAYDRGHRWGHMTTNLAKSINSVLKGTRTLPITSLVTETYFKLGKLFD